MGEEARPITPDTDTHRPRKALFAGAVATRREICRPTNGDSALWSQALCRTRTGDPFLTMEIGMSPQVARCRSGTMIPRIAPNANDSYGHSDVSVGCPFAKPLRRGPNTTSSEFV